MRAQSYTIFATFALLALGGCGSPPAAAVSDPNLAKSTLTKVLDSWKNGDAFDALAKASPVIYVADQDWQGGAKLESYTIESSDTMSDTSLQCPVSLKLKDAKGKPVVRTAIYAVTTTPVLRVDRHD